MPNASYKALTTALEAGYEVVREIEGHYVTVTEACLTYKRETRYAYFAPTHWSDGICRVSATESRRPEEAPSVEYHAGGSGGYESGFSDLEYADAIATAQRAAFERLVELQPNLVAELDVKYGKAGALTPR